MKLAFVVSVLLHPWAGATTNPSNSPPTTPTPGPSGTPPRNETSDHSGGLDKQDGCPRSSDVCELREQSVDSLVATASSAKTIAKHAPFCKFWPKVNVFALYCQYVQFMMQEIEFTMKDIKGSGFAENCAQAEAELRRIIAGMQYTRPMIARVAIDEIELDIGGFSFITDFENRITKGCIEDFATCEDVCVQLLGADCVNGEADCLANCKKLMVQQCSPDRFNMFDTFCEELEAGLHSELGPEFLDIPVEIVDELLGGCTHIRSEYQTYCEGAFEDDRCAKVVLIDENANADCLGACNEIQREFQCGIDEQCCADNRMCGECCSDEECVNLYGEGALCPVETNICEGGNKCFNETQCDVDNGEKCCPDNLKCGQCCFDEECEALGFGWCSLETNICEGGNKCEAQCDVDNGEKCCPDNLKCGQCCSDEECEALGFGWCSLETNQCEGGESSCSACVGNRPVCCRGTRLYLWLLCSLVQGTDDTFCCSTSAAKSACV